MKTLRVRVVRFVRHIGAAVPIFAVLAVGKGFAAVHQPAQRMPYVIAAVAHGLLVVYALMLEDQKRLIARLVESGTDMAERLRWYRAREADRRREPSRRPDGGRGDVVLLLAVVVLVVLVVGGVVTGLSSALGNLTDQVCAQQSTPACEGRP